MLETIRHFETTRAEVHKKIMPDNNYRGLHFSKINCLTRLNKSFKEQSDDRIKLTMFLNLGKIPVLNVDTEYARDGKD